MENSEYENVKLFNPMPIYYLLKVINKVKLELETTNTCGICKILDGMVFLHELTNDLKNEVLSTLFNFGVQHGKIAKDIDPTCQYWFTPYDQAERIAFLNWFLEEFPKAVERSK